MISEEHRRILYISFADWIYFLMISNICTKCSRRTWFCLIFEKRNIPLAVCFMYPVYNNVDLNTIKHCLVSYINIIHSIVDVMFQSVLSSYQWSRPVNNDNINIYSAACFLLNFLLFIYALWIMINVNPIKRVKGIRSFAWDENSTKNKRPVLQPLM